VKIERIFLIFITFISCFSKTYGQDITLFHQFNGRYDFTFIGNTMNTAENNSINASVTLTSSSADLNLPNDVVIEKAYLYWAGCGDGDFEVKLNEETITPDRTFELSRDFDGFIFTYFSAFKDVTSQIQTTGNGTYTLSDLDISAFEQWHLNRRTNFSGWAILLILKNENLPLNQINIYDGLQGVPDELSITLDSLNVLDNNNSKIGFLAWEGDVLLPTETFTFNGNPLTNAQNPENNVFNGSNSITGSSTFYNMDLDIYDIQNNITVGDTIAEISLRSTQDFVMINTVVTKLNNQLPDATVSIDNIEKSCNSRAIIVNYTIYNLNSTNYLPSGTPIAIYINDTLFEEIETLFPLEIDEHYSDQITLTIPDSFPDSFELKFVVDDIGNGTGIRNELIETNNSFIADFSFFEPLTFNPLEDIVTCNEGFSRGTFDFSEYEELVKTNPDFTVKFYENQQDASLQINEIWNTNNYIATSTPKEIFVRINDEFCFNTTSFLLKTKNCPPTVYNYISANNDTKNDFFFIDGLRDIFLDFKIEIYNRWGKLVWTGNQNTEDWTGYIKDGFSIKKATDGTYFYLLFLNDIDYPQPLKGYLYINQ
jgi:gliding motility-associated-like protein